MHNKSAVIRFVDESDLEVIRITDDSFELPSQRKFKDNGAMIAPATIARTGVMEYSAGQLGKLFADMPPSSIIKVMTREEDLFHEDSLESYRSAPITIGHPKEDVTIENAAELQHGNLDGIPMRDGDHLTGQIVLSTAKAIDLVEAGVEQLSSGHDARLVRLSDEDAERLGYHAYKTNIRCNHIAIVPRGRAGSARIADNAEEVVEGVVDNAELKDDQEQEAKLYDQEYVSGLEARIDAQEAEVAALKAQLKDAQEAASDEALEQRVQELLDFRAGVSKFTDADISGMSKVDAMRVALQDALGKDYSKHSDTFVETRYAILLEEGVPGGDTEITQALRDHASSLHVNSELTPKESPAATARARMIARYTSK